MTERETSKLAFDVDATDVIVSFKDVTGPNGSIVVLDNGSGMTLETMKRGWMRIATNDATVNARSEKFGRPRTGAKGVGRFACARLASRLSLESISSVLDGSERVAAEFNWREFEPGRILADVTSFERAYGNYLGLCHLGRFMAHEMGLTLSQVVCIATPAARDRKKRDLAGLAQQVKSAL